MHTPTTQLLSPAPGSPLTVIGRLAWAEWALMALALFTVHFLLQENGTLISTHTAQLLHEITHDARHALGAPCH